MIKTNQLNKRAVQVVVLLAVIIIAGFAAWAVYSYQYPTSSPTSPTASLPALNTSAIANVSAAPQIRTAKDLSTADQTLVQNDPSTTSSSDLSLLSQDSNSF